MKKWVSIAEALGWGRTAPSPTFCNSGHGGAGIEWGGNSVRKAMRQQSLTGDQWMPKDGAEPGTNDAIRVSPAEAAALQSYPNGAVFRNGNQANAAKRPLDAPAPTIMSGARSNKVEWIDAESAEDPAASGVRVTVEEASALQSFPMVGFPRLSDGKAETTSTAPPTAPGICGRQTIRRRPSPRKPGHGNASTLTAPSTASPSTKRARCSPTTAPSSGPDRRRSNTCR